MTAERRALIQTLDYAKSLEATVEELRNDLRRSNEQRRQLEYKLAEIRSMSRGHDTSPPMPSDGCEAQMPMPQGAPMACENETEDFRMAKERERMR